MERRIAENVTGGWIRTPTDEQLHRVGMPAARSGEQHVVQRVFDLTGAAIVQDQRSGVGTVRMHRGEIPRGIGQSVAGQEVRVGARVKQYAHVFDRCGAYCSNMQGRLVALVHCIEH